MIKTKKGFLMEQLNIDKLSPLQWQGIMIAMDKYAEHYHETKFKKLRLGEIVGQSGQLHECIHRKGKECIKTSSCYAFGCNKPI